MRWKNGTVANVEDKHFLSVKYFLYVKLVGYQKDNLPELPDIKLPMGTHCLLEKHNKYLPSG